MFLSGCWGVSGDFKEAGMQNEVVVMVKYYMVAKVYFVFAGVNSGVLIMLVVVAVVEVMTMYWIY